MRVWRVEDRHGIGPYQSEKINLPGVSTARHPAPPRDFSPKELKKLDRMFPLGPDSPGVAFGFSSLDQLREWFWGYLHDLNRHGFHIVEFEVPEKYLASGYHQVAFDKRYAQVLGRHGMHYAPEGARKRLPYRREEPTGMDYMRAFMDLAF